MSKRYISIHDAPRDGTRIRLLIPYDNPHWDKGAWSIEEQCFRFDGDDGPDDIQPIGWKLL